VCISARAVDLIGRTAGSVTRRSGGVGGRERRGAPLSRFDTPIELARANGFYQAMPGKH
jgi:hypothetical protein